MTAADDAAFELERLTADGLDAEDESVLASVRAAYEARDPMPESLVARIQFELTLDALHAEIATLHQLDLATSGARAGGTEDVRTITFTSDSLTTMVTITPLEGDAVRIDGWVAPGGAMRVETIRPGGVQETFTDADGRFVFDRIPTGLAKFAVHVPRGEDFSTVMTPTIEL